MKQNAPDYCRRANALRSRFHARVGSAERQKERIMSPKIEFPQSNQMQTLATKRFASRCTGRSKTKSENPRAPELYVEFCSRGARQNSAAATVDARLSRAANGRPANRNGVGRGVGRLRCRAPRFAELRECGFDLGVQLVELADQLVVPRIEPIQEFAGCGHAGNLEGGPMINELWRIEHRPLADQQSSICNHRSISGRVGSSQESIGCRSTAPLSSSHRQRRLGRSAWQDVRVRRDVASGSRVALAAAAKAEPVAETWPDLPVMPTETAGVDDPARRQ